MASLHQTAKRSVSEGFYFENQLRSREVGSGNQLELTDLINATELSLFQLAARLSTRVSPSHRSGVELKRRGGDVGVLR